MKPTKQVEDLVVWQEARRLRTELGRLVNTEAFERNGLVGPRLQADALEVLAAIADGYARGPGEELAAGLTDALGAAGRIRSLLCAALDDQLLSEADFLRAREEWEALSRRVGSFRSYLRTGKRAGERAADSPEDSRTGPPAGGAPPAGRGEAHRPPPPPRPPSGPRESRSAGGPPIRSRPSP
ncbi:MAG: four helix bundle protein [Verrucomicrobiota bacterium]